MSQGIRRLSRVGLKTAHGSTKDAVVVNDQLRVDQWKDAALLLGDQFYLILGNTEDTLFLNRELASTPAAGVDIQVALPEYFSFFESTPIDVIASVASYDANDITYENSGSGLSATDVQSAIDEVASSTAGMTEAQHAALRQLIHFVSEGPGSGFASGAVRTVESVNFALQPTEIVWYTNAAKTERIVDQIITYDAVFPATFQWRMYATDGSTILTTLTDTAANPRDINTEWTRTYV